MQGREIGGAEGVFFKRNEMQASATLGVIAPGLPGGEEIETYAEAGLDNNEGLTSAPPGALAEQSVASEEDVARLAEATRGGVVDVVIRC